MNREKGSEDSLCRNLYVPSVAGRSWQRSRFAQAKYRLHHDVSVCWLKPVTFSRIRYRPVLLTFVGYLLLFFCGFCATTRFEVWLVLYEPFAGLAEVDSGDSVALVSVSTCPARSLSLRPVICMSSTSCRRRSRMAIAAGHLRSICPRLLATASRLHHPSGIPCLFKFATSKKSIRLRGYEQNALVIQRQLSIDGATQENAA